MRPFPTRPSTLSLPHALPISSDLAVALVALDAMVEVRGAGGQRTVPLIDFHRLPSETPHVETVLEPGEVIAAITVPARSEEHTSEFQSRLQIVCRVLLEIKNK